MKKYIVTGASGFIGKALVKELLNRNNKVFAITTNKNNLSDLSRYKNLDIIEANYSDYEKIKDEELYNIDGFYHLAWEGAYGKKSIDIKIQLNNIDGAIKAIELAQNIKCKKFLLAGTVAELDIIEHIDKNVCSPRNVCIYANSKLSAEMFCKIIAYNGNIEFNSALLANTFGVGDYSMRSTNFILSKLIKDEPLKLVAGTQLNDWIYIDDTIKLLIATMEKGKHLKTYYIGHKKLRSLREIISEARDILNPNMILNFGELEDTFITNYDYTDLNALYNDTGEEANVDFKYSILKTAEWIKEGMNNV